MKVFLRLIIISIFGTMGLLLMACGAPAFELTGDQGQESAEIPVTVCMSSMSFSRAGVEYAAQFGIFKKYGLDVDLIDIGGGTDAVTVLASGQADICQISGPAVVNAALAGADLVFVGGLINQQLYSLVGGQDIQSGADLRGKVVGSSEPGSSSDAILHLGLELLGLDPEKDVTIISTGSQTQRMAALQAGSVAATVITVPESSRAKSMGYSILLEPQDMNLPYQHTGIITSKSTLSENREMVVRFLKAIAEAIIRMQADRDGTLTMMAGVLLLDETQDALFLNEAYDEIVLKIFDESLQPSRDGLQYLIDEAKSENPTALDLTVNDIVDTSIMDELQTSGFLADLRE